MVGSREEKGFLMKVFENIDTFKDWDKDYYPPLARWYYDRAIPRMIDLLTPEPGGLILDAGCGPGVHSIRVAELGYSVWAVDFSESVLEEARGRAEAAAVGEKIRFERADLTSLPFDDASFDRIFSWGVLIHIPKITEALDELARITREGGRLALQITNDFSMDRHLERMARFILRRPLGEKKETTLGTGHWYDLHGERLWVWMLNIPRVIEYMKERGFRLVARRSGEFTEIQRRLHGWPRNLLLACNNAWFKLKLPAAPAMTNIIVLEKE